MTILEAAEAALEIAEQALRDFAWIDDGYHYDPTAEAELIPIREAIAQSRQELAELMEPWPT